MVFVDVGATAGRSSTSSCTSKSNATANGGGNVDPTTRWHPADAATIASNATAAPAAAIKTNASDETTSRRSTARRSHSTVFSGMLFFIFSSNTQWGFNNRFFVFIESLMPKNN